MAHPHALQLAPNAPVLLNHDEQRRIGRLVELAEWDESDGRWTFARCVLDEVPEWLRVGAYNGSAASMSWIDLSHSQQMPGGWRRYNAGLITEVSVLTPSVEPVEKRARVGFLQRSDHHRLRADSAPTARSPVGQAASLEAAVKPGTVCGAPGPQHCRIAARPNVLNYKRTSSTAVARKPTVAVISHRRWVNDRWRRLRPPLSTEFIGFARGRLARAAQAAFAPD